METDYNKAVDEMEESFKNIIKELRDVVSSDMFKSLSNDGKALCFTTKLLMLQNGVK